MPLPCEFAVKSIVPAFRSLVARELVETFNFKQEKIAELLEVTQPAISQYTRNIRGKTLDFDGIEQIRLIAKSLATSLATKSISSKQINRKYCEACRTAREKRIICELHKRLDPLFNVDDCDTCLTDACSFSSNIP
jgi:predicted transcriptional regulator